MFFPACLKSSDVLHYVLTAPGPRWQEKEPTEEQLMPSCVQGWCSVWLSQLLQPHLCWVMGKLCLAGQQMSEQSQVLSLAWACVTIPRPGWVPSTCLVLPWEANSSFIPNKHREVTLCKLNGALVFHSWETWSHRRCWGRNGFEVLFQCVPQGFFVVSFLFPYTRFLLFKYMYFKWLCK